MGQALWKRRVRAPSIVWVQARLRDLPPEHPGLLSFIRWIVSGFVEWWRNLSALLSGSRRSLSCF